MPQVKDKGPKGPAEPNSRCQTPGAKLEVAPANPRGSCFGLYVAWKDFRLLPDRSLEVHFLTLGPMPGLSYSRLPLHLLRLPGPAHTLRKAVASFNSLNCWGPPGPTASLSLLSHSICMKILGFPEGTGVKHGKEIHKSEVELHEAEVESIWL